MNFLDVVFSNVWHNFNWLLEAEFYIDVVVVVVLNNFED